MECAVAPVAVFRVTITVALLIAADSAAAHVVLRRAPIEASLASGAPWITAALVVTGVAYGAGVRRLWSATATGRGIRRRDAAAFAGGWLALAVALLGPLDAWAERSFAAHMLQHEILMLVAAPLFVIGRPLAAWTWALPRRAHRTVRRVLASTALSRFWRAFTQPLGATVVQLAVLFVLHVPRLFDFAATHAGAHAAQHTMFLASALCFWWATRGPLVHRRIGQESGAGAALACLFVTMLATGALGALLAFASSPWYPIYTASTLPWSAGPLEDQQLGGLVMWIPGGCVYLVAGLARARELLLRDGIASSPARDVLHPAPRTPQRIAAWKVLH
jgi:putative membrane protein